MGNTRTVKFGDKTIRRMVLRSESRLYCKIRDCLWEVRQTGSYFEVVGPFSAKEKKHAFGHVLPQEFIDKLRTIPESGAGYQRVCILTKTGYLHRDVVVIDSSVVPNYIDIDQIADVYKEDPGMLPGKIDNMVRAIQDVIDAVGCDPTKPGGVPCTDLCPIKQVCRSMCKITMWSVLLKAKARGESR